MPPLEPSRQFQIRLRQSGISLILLVFLIALAATGLAVRALSSGSIQIARNVSSANSLKDAKDALIGYALTYESGSVPNPGRFPCAENTSLIGGANEGQAMSSCTTSYKPGRLAWRTLGLGDLRDGNNDNLWYALSPAFNNSAAAINSDTSPSLKVDNIANSAIAVILSPGNVLSTQSRPNISASSAPSVSNYLDSTNATNTASFITGTSSSTFNDSSLTLKPDDVFPVMEKRVLAEIKNYLLTYKALWGAYPFPATFSNPSSASYIGVKTNTGGLLPIADAGVSWGTSFWFTYSSTEGFNIGTCSLSSGNQVLTCSIPSQSSPTSRLLTINASLSNVALGFYKQMTVTNTSDFTITSSTTKSLINAPGAIQYSLNSSGGGTVTIQIQTTAVAGSYTVKFNRPPQLDNWNTTSNIANYIYQNKWHNLIYYKVALPYLPGGTGVCGTNNCLTVNSINTTPNTSKANVGALLVSAGRKLDITNARPAPAYSSSTPAQSRPGTTLADYLDSTNNIAADTGLIFESTNLPLSSFNDQVEVVE